MRWFKFLCFYVKIIIQLTSSGNKERTLLFFFPLNAGKSMHYLFKRVFCITRVPSFFYLLISHPYYNLLLFNLQTNSMAKYDSKD